MANEKFALPSGWRIKKLRDLGRIVTGKTPPTKINKYFGGQVPFITPSDMDGRRVIADTQRYLSDEGVAAVSGARIPEGSVMVSCIGSDMGNVALAGRNAVTNQQINSIIVEENILNLFVYYNLSNRKAEFQNLASSGSAQPILNKGHFSQIYIVLPTLEEQHVIAHILGTLDDKIELNRRMNETLESIAHTIFKSWFVDFDPVRAKADGRQPAGMDAETAALFPDSFEESEIGKIPQGWQCQQLDNIADFRNGLALQKYPPEGDEYLPVIKIAELRKGVTGSSGKASINLNPDYIVDNGDVLFSWSGSLEVVLWYGGRGALNQHLFKVTSDFFPKWFYYFWIDQHLPDFRRIASGKATTMGHIQRHHLSDALVLVSPHNLLKRMTNIVAPLLDKVVAGNAENSTLTAMRDTLLPKLISGEIRVKDAEKFVEELDEQP